VRTAAAGLTLLQGFESWGKRAYDAGTMGTYRRAIRTYDLWGVRRTSTVSRVLIRLRPSL
jgi:hypothetical protein